MVSCAHDDIAGQPAAVHTAPVNVAVAADDVAVVEMLTRGIPENK